MLNLDELLIKLVVLCSINIHGLVTLQEYRLTIKMIKPKQTECNIDNSLNFCLIFPLILGLKLIMVEQGYDIHIRPNIY